MLELQPTIEASALVRYLPLCAVTNQNKNLRVQNSWCRWDDGKEIETNKPTWVILESHPSFLSFTDSVFSIFWLPSGGNLTQILCHEYEIRPPVTTINHVVKLFKNLSF